MEKKENLKPIPNHTEEITKAVLNSASQIHIALGPGLLESVYEACMGHELKLRGINVKSQVTLPVIYKGMKVDSGFRLDLFVDDSVIVEKKSTDDISPVYKPQLLTNLRLSNIRVGLLINFDTIHLREGIKN